MSYKCLIPQSACFFSDFSMVSLRSLLGQIIYERNYFFSQTSFLKQRSLKQGGKAKTKNKIQSAKMMGKE